MRYSDLRVRVFGCFLNRIFCSAWSKRHVKRIFHHVFTFDSTEYFLAFSPELRIVEVEAVPADVSGVMVRASALAMLAMLFFGIISVA